MSTCSLRLRELESGHHESIRGQEASRWGLALPILILSTLVGPQAASALGSAPRVLVGLSGASAVALAAGLMFLRSTKRAEKHRAAAARTRAARRRIEGILERGGEVSDQELAQIRQQVDQLDEEALAISPRAWARVKARMGESRPIPSMPPADSLGG